MRSLLELPAYTALEFKQSTPDLTQKLLKAQVPQGHLLSSRCQLSHQQPPLNASLIARLASISWSSPPQRVLVGSLLLFPESQVFMHRAWRRKEGRLQLMPLLVLPVFSLQERGIVESWWVSIAILQVCSRGLWCFQYPLRGSMRSKLFSSWYREVVCLSFPCWYLQRWHKSNRE